MSTARPMFHLTPPRGWMNDPCSPYQDSTAVYHCYYQWVPNSTDWTHEIGWGHAWSVDGVVWESDPDPVLMPGSKGSYDALGVFTGGLWPGSHKHSPIILYSAINGLVDQDAGYVNGQERLALAVSDNEGREVIKDERLLSVFPPPNVTGWRDPFLYTWPSLDRLRGSEKEMYAVLAGGIKDVGPTLFLYRLPSEGSFTERAHGQWEFLGPLFEPVSRPNPPDSPWIGDLGHNWECPSFFTLGETDFVIVGSEGKWSDKTAYQSRKMPSWQIWFSGKLATTASGVEFQKTLEGVVDWGNYYAAQTFKANDGWLVDNDLDEHGRRAQGWAGAMSCLRELILQEVTGVTGTLSCDFNTSPPSPFEVFRTGTDSDGYRVKTLGIKPVEELRKARSDEVDMSSGMTSVSMATFDAELSACVSEKSAPVGLELAFEQGSAKIVFSPIDERIIVERSGTAPPGLGINTDTEYGKHTLFRRLRGVEPLELRVIYDHGIVEIFANDRFALSTRLYGGSCRVGLLQGEAEAEAAHARVWRLAREKSDR